MNRQGTLNSFRNVILITCQFVYASRKRLLNLFYFITISPCSPLNLAAPNRWWSVNLPGQRMTCSVHAGCKVCTHLGGLSSIQCSRVPMTKIGVRNVVDRSPHYCHVIGRLISNDVISIEICVIHLITLRHRSCDDLCWKCLNSAIASD